MVHKSAIFGCMQIFTSVLLVLLFTGSASAQLNGTWYAVLHAAGQQIPLNIELTEVADGWTGSLESPTQSRKLLPLNGLRVASDTLTFEITSAAIGFAARISSDSISGTFRQMTFSTPLVFYRKPPPAYEKEEGVATNLRPQDPTDFPYRREAVSFPGGEEDVTLAGELTLPADTLPGALVVLVSGSGPQDRNEEIGGSVDHRPFLVISDYLTRRGYGVLRYDDRGVAESTGDFSSSTTADFAADAAAAVSYLRGRQDLSNIPTGILGHSEGGMIAPMVAYTDSIDFMVLLATPGFPIDSLMIDQRRAITGMAAPDEPVLQTAYTYIKAHPEQSGKTFADGLRDTLVSIIPGLPAPLANSVVDPEAFATTYASALTDPWMRYFIAFDPTLYLERVKVSVLAINGTLDKQVTVGNLDAISAALSRAGNNDLTIIRAEGLNHLMQPAVTGLPGEYGEIELTVDEGILEAIFDWLNARYLGTAHGENHVRFSWVSNH